VILDHARAAAFLIADGRRFREMWPELHRPDDHPACGQRLAVKSV